MADFNITINGTAYDSFEAAIDAVRRARDEVKAANRDPRIDGDKADYLAFKGDNRPDDAEFEGPTPEVFREVFETNLAAALEAREPVAAE